MKIDLRNVYTLWINLDEKTDNAQYMENLFKENGFTNTERFSAIKKSTPTADRIGEQHYPGIAESQFACMRKIIQRGYPALILEDDVAINKDIFFPEIEVPDDCDAFYLGTSHGDNHYSAVSVGNGICKIKNMLSAHAILYTSDRYINDIVTNGPRYVEEQKKPFDVYTYQIQQRYNIYSFPAPFFYQSDDRNNANKWEAMTKNPLRITKKFSVFTI